jgi:hypothetical protein
MASSNAGQIQKNRLVSIKNGRKRIKYQRPWSADQSKSPWAMAALVMALRLRRPSPGLNHYSDRGVQYPSGA